MRNPFLLLILPTFVAVSWGRVSDALPSKAYVELLGANAWFQDPDFTKKFRAITGSSLAIEFLDPGDHTSHGPESAVDHLPVPRGNHGERPPKGKALTVDLIDPSGNVVQVWCIAASGRIEQEAAINFDKSCKMRPGFVHSKPEYFLTVSECVFDGKD